MTESTQQPDMSKSAQEVDTLLMAVNAALDKLGGMNIPEDPFERLSWLRDFAWALGADRAKELEADARRYRFLRTCGAMVPGTVYRWNYRDELDAAIDRAQGEQA